MALSGEKVRRLIIEILSDASGVEKGMTAAEKAADKFNKNVAHKVLAVGGAVEGLGLTLEHLSQPIEQSRKQLEAGFGAAGLNFDEFKGKIDAADRRMENFGHGFGDTDAALNTLTIALGDPTKALNDMQLVADIAGKKHLSLAEAADIVAKAHAGSAKAFKQFGIIVGTNADGTKDYEGAIDKLRVKLAGQASAAVDTFGGKFGILKTKVGDIVGTFGKDLVPVLTIAGPLLLGLGTIIETGIVPALASATVAAAPWIAAAAAIAAIAYLIIRNWDSIVDFFEKLPGRVLDFLKGLPDLLLDLGKKLLGGLLTGLEWYADNVLKKFYIDLPLMILGWVGDVAGWLFDVGKKILGGLLDGIEWLATTGLKAYFIDIPLKILEWIGKAELWLFDKGKDLLGGLLDGIKWVAENILYQYFIGIPLKILEWIGKAELWLFDKGKDILKGLWHGLEDAISDVFTWFFNFPHLLWQWLEKAGDWLIDTGRDLVKGIVKGIKEAPSAIRDALIALIPGGASTADKILKWVGIPAFAEGGYVGGPVGVPQLAVVHGGEYVVSNAMQRGGGGATNNFNLTVNAGMGTDGREVGDQIAAALTNFVARNGRLPWMGK